MPIIGKDYTAGIDEKIFQLKNTFNREFPETLESTIACLSVIAQLKIEDIRNCFLLILIDAPGSRKTIVLSYFFDIDRITYHTDDWTPKSFVTHAANVPREELEDIDLLPRIIGKTLVIPELATVFDVPYEKLIQNFGTLTRVLDGQGFRTESGVHGSRGYTGVEGDYVFCMLGGVAFIPRLVWKVLGNMGSRTYFYNLPPSPEDVNYLVELLKEDFNRKVSICRNAVRSFLINLWEQCPSKVKWQKDKDEQEALKIIAKAAILLSKLRGTTVIQQIGTENEKSEYYWEEPVIERPYRANQMLYNLARGHALIHGRKYITTDDLLLVMKVALSSANSKRVELLDFLIKNKGSAKTEEFEKYLNCSKPVASTTMKTLEVIGLVDIIKGKTGEKGGRPPNVAKLKPAFQWLLTSEYSRFRRR